MAVEADAWRSLSDVVSLVVRQITPPVSVEAPVACPHAGLANHG